MKAGEVHQGRVFGTAAWGIYLDVDGVHVLVHVSDVEWTNDVGCTEYCKVGDVLDVKILRVVDEKTVLGWLPPPGERLRS